MITRGRATDSAPHHSIFTLSATSHCKHHCVVGEDRANAIEQAAQFLGRRVKRGHRVVIVAPPESRDELARALARKSVDVAAQVSAAALSFCDPADVGLPGDPAGVLGSVCRGVPYREDDGQYADTYVVFDLEAVPGHTERWDRLWEWECRLSSILPEYPVVAALCLYDQSRVAADALDRFLRCHPTVVVGGRIFTNPFFEPYLLDAPALLSWKLDRIRVLPAEEKVNRIVAHDLRDSLNAVSLATRMLRKHVTDPSGDAKEAKEFLDVIRRAVAFMTRLVDDLLDVARIEAWELWIRPHPIPADSLVSDALQVHGYAAAARLQTVQTDVPGDLPPVLADRDRVLQVFSNLLSNAIKFTPEGGTIRVSAQARGNEVIFTVADSGPGIAPEEIEHLFDRFWQATHAHRAGAGLGLAIAKGIVEAHGGRIWVESELGGGTVFTFSLPAVQGVIEKENARPAAD